MRRHSVQQTALYRHFDAEGILLYIGIALSPVQRLRKHRDESTWFDRIASITIERFPTREEAKQAESVAIKSERPLFNIAHVQRLPDWFFDGLESSPCMKEMALKASVAKTLARYLGIS